MPFENGVRLGVALVAEIDLGGDLGDLRHVGEVVGAWVVLVSKKFISGAKSGL